MAEVLKADSTELYRKVAQTWRLCCVYLTVTYNKREYMYHIRTFVNHFNEYAPCRGQETQQVAFGWFNLICGMNYS